MSITERGGVRVLNLARRICLQGDLGLRPYIYICTREGYGSRDHPEEDPCASTLDYVPSIHDAYYE